MAKKPPSLAEIQKKNVQKAKQQDAKDAARRAKAYQEKASRTSGPSKAKPEMVSAQNKLNPVRQRAAYIDEQVSPTKKPKKK